MPVPIKAYACRFRCGRIGTKQAAVAEHERRCFRNPATRSCRTCGHLGSDSQTVYDPHHGGRPGASDYDVTFPVCEADETIDLRADGLRTGCELWAKRSKS
jgi:hypothetical protein